MDRLFLLLLAGEAGLLAAVVLLALRLRRERREREAALALFGERAAEAESRGLRLALLDRRRAVIEPIEGLRLAFAATCAPDRRLFAEAGRAIGEARLVFAGEHEAELGAVEALLCDYLRNEGLQRDALRAGRHSDRFTLLDEAGRIERSLAERLARLGAALNEAARVEA